MATYVARCNPLPSRKITVTPGTTKRLTDFLATNDAVPAAKPAADSDDLFCNKIVIRAHPGNTSTERIWVGIEKSDLATPAIIDKTNYENVLDILAPGAQCVITQDVNGNPIRARSILVDADNVANIAIAYMHIR